MSLLQRVLARDGRPRSEASQQRASGPGARAQALKLLVVDDSSTVRNRIARVVERKRLPIEMVVALARDGQEALNLARLIRPELVTMDLTMPGVDGLACIPQLLLRDPRTRILVVSALADKSTAIEALRLGARGFLAKPFGDDELLLALLELIEP